MKKQTKSQEQFLFIQVYQMGIVQIEKTFNLNSLFSRRIKIGQSRFCELYLPFERQASELNIFKIGKGKAEIFLDPRLKGYINTSQKFGDILEFTAPRDALGVLTSVDDPLSVNLKKGARGRIKFFGFEIVFKIESLQKHKPSSHVPKLGGSFFKFSPADSPIEKNTFWLSLFATASVFIPLVYWLLTFPNKESSGLLNIPAEMTSEFIAPENMRLLPFVFGKDFNPEKTTQLALLWVRELQLKWDSAHAGKQYKSLIPFLSDSKSVIEKNNNVAQFQMGIVQNYKDLDLKKIKLSQKERYFNYLKQSSMLTSFISGQQGQSNYFTVGKMLHNLTLADKAIVEYLLLDHFVVKDYYQKQHSAKKLGIVESPQTGQVLGPQPDPIFTTEYHNYKSAEYFSTISEKSEFRKNLKQFLEKESLEKNHFLNPNTILINKILLDKNGLVNAYAYNSSNSQISTRQDYDNYLYNALFSEAFILPPLPKVKAIIDLKMVQFVLYNKQEELRSCYNSALRKNSHLKGRLKLKFGIDGRGKAINIQTVQSFKKDDLFLNCLKSRISTWNFPKSKNGVYELEFPLIFVHAEEL